VPELQQGDRLMATAVQMTITLDANGAIANVGQLKNEIATVGTQAGTTGQKAESAFNGIESAERQSHIAGQLITRTIGVEIPRALETVIARSQTLGPIFQGLFGVGVAAAGATAIAGIVEKIDAATEAAGGYSEAIKRVEQETIQASQKAFVQPQTLALASQHLAELNQEMLALQNTGKTQLSTLGALIAPELGVVAGVAEENDHREKSVALTDQQRQLMEQITALQHQQTLAIDQSNAKAAEAGLQGFALAAQRHKDSLQQLSDTYTGPAAGGAEDQAARLAADKEYYAQTASLARQNAQETTALRNQVVEDALTGTDKIYQHEANEIKDLDAKRAQSLISYKDYLDRKQSAAQQAAEKEAALNDAAEKETASLEKKARDASLQGDDLVLAHKKDEIAKATAAYAKHEIDVEQFERRIVAINQDADNQIAKTDQQAAEKRKQILDQAAEDQKNAEQTIAIASVDEWHRAYAQIEIEALNKIKTINQAEQKALQDYQQTDEEYVAIEKSAQAKREAVWAETNQKIQEEHKRQVEQLGADLESLFNDISSGNIGQRILNNMKKLFAQIVAQWLLSTQMMGSAFGGLFGSILFGPGSSGANFFGSGSSPAGAASSNPLGALLGGIFGAAQRHQHRLSRHQEPPSAVLSPGDRPQRR
jgi:hypothetical protein